jgi:hypothetical protein
MLALPARLPDAQVLEAERMYGDLPLTDAEIEAWKRQPETFFGEVRDLKTVET